MKVETSAELFDAYSEGRGYKGIGRPIEPVLNNGTSSQQVSPASTSERTTKETSQPAVIAVGDADLPKAASAGIQNIVRGTSATKPPFGW